MQVLYTALASRLSPKTLKHDDQLLVQIDVVNLGVEQ
jgi:hypothetical protein